MNRRHALARLATVALIAALPASALAEEVVKVGLILPMTGPSASTGRQVSQAVALFQALNGKTVAGKTVEVIVKDDTGAADQTKRLAQELVVNDHVQVLAGFGLTPLALAAAPIATQAKVPELVMAAATATITEASPFVVRTSFTLPQVTVPAAEYAAKSGAKKVVTLVTDYAPGIDAEKAFKEKFTSLGGAVVAELRVPLKNPDFAPFLQRVADEKPDAVFVFVPSGFGGLFVKQFVERGLDKSGVKLIATGDVLDDDLIDQMGDVVLGVTSTHHYSAAHASAENKAFVTAYEKANGGQRPNFMALGGWDGMALLYAALKKTNGDASGAALVEAMKGMAWTSPRGPISIDPATRDIVQNVYVRTVEKVDGHLYNVEKSTFEAVKDPVKAAKAK